MSGSGVFSPKSGQRHEVRSDEENVCKSKARRGSRILWFLVAQNVARKNRGGESREEARRESFARDWAKGGGVFGVHGSKNVMSGTGVCVQTTWLHGC